MEAEHAIAAAALGFFLAGGLQMFLSVRRGRELCRMFAERLPEAYESAGSPHPGYFDSVRRSAYFRFVLQRSFEGLADGHLVSEFSRLRRMEIRQLVFLVGGFAAFGLAILWLKLVPGS